MANVNFKVDLSIHAIAQQQLDLGSVSFDSSVSKTVRFVPGTASIAQADILWSDTRTLTTAATENLDLAGGLTDAFGTAISFAEITGIYIENTGTTAITIGGATTNAFVGPFGANTHTLSIPAGDIFMLTNMNGWTVTAATGDILKVTNGAGATNIYNIMLVGRSVAA